MKTGVSYLSTDFVIDEKTKMTTCTIKYHVNTSKIRNFQLMCETIPKLKKYVSQFIFDDTGFILTESASTVCMSSDTYNEDEGKWLAKMKAQRHIFSIVTEIYDNIINIISTFCTDDLFRRSDNACIASIKCENDFNDLANL